LSLKTYITARKSQAGHWNPDAGLNRKMVTINGLKQSAEAGKGD
jgi:hypothetical protein